MLAPPVPPGAAVAESTSSQASSPAVGVTSSHASSTELPPLAANTNEPVSPISIVIVLVSNTSVVTSSPFST